MSMHLQAAARCRDAAAANAAQSESGESSEDGFLSEDGSETRWWGDDEDEDTRHRVVQRSLHQALRSRVRLACLSFRSLVIRERVPRPLPTGGGSAPRWIASAETVAALRGGDPAAVVECISAFEAHGLLVLRGACSPRACQECKECVTEV